MKHYQIRQSITDRSSISVDLYLKDISKYPLLTESEENELIKQILDGDEKAKEKLIQSNLRFVVSIAKQYQGKGIDLADLIACGNIGLMRAASHFNPEYNCRFVSYAVWWIRDCILKEILDHGKSIRIPAEKITKINKISREISKFEQINGRIPSLSEISSIMNMSEDDIKDLVSQCTITIVPDSVINPDGEVESLFETLYLEEGNTDKITKQQSALISIIDFLKQNLNDTEYEVITKYFGLDGPEISLDVIGEQNNITKERVRQIKDKAIIKLRKCDNINLLTHFL